ncbi:unknown [Bacteroides sp. CAG:1076]|jgi:hypothetical protein|nr:unknown [Bacteroides sp. CAG:1076]
MQYSDYIRIFVIDKPGLGKLFDTFFVLYVKGL